MQIYKRLIAIMVTPCFLTAPLEPCLAEVPGTLPFIPPATHHQHLDHLYSSGALSTNTSTNTTTGMHHHWFNVGTTSSSSNGGSNTGSTSVYHHHFNDIASVSNATNGAAYIHSGTMPSINLNLSSTVANVTAGHILQNQNVVINIAGVPTTVNANTLLTPAEKVAVYQVLGGHTQTITLDTQGSADGGVVVITPHLSQLLGSLTIPQGVTVIDLSKGGILNLTGNLVDDGSLYITASNPTLSTLTVDAVNINVQSGGLLSDILPAGGLDGFHNILSSVNLDLTAQGNVTNAGTITSSGTLGLTTGSGNITNSGLIASTGGNINVESGNPATNIDINGAGGTFSAVNGNINVGDPSNDQTGNTTIAGGNYLSENLNINAGTTGTVNASVDQVTGTLNINAGSSNFTASTGTLNIGNENITGDPSFYNTSGNVDISGNLEFGGEDLAIVAEGNIVNTKSGDIISTANTLGNGGNIVMIAGANFTSSSGASSVTTGGDTSSTLTINGGSGAGGYIELTGGTGAGGGSTPITSLTSAGSVNGGNISLIAYGGTGTNAGTINLPTGVTVTANGGSAGTGGNVTVIAGSTAGSGATAIDIPGGISTTGYAGGNIMVEAAALLNTGSAYVLQDNSNGTVTGSASVPVSLGALQNTAVTLGALSTNSTVSSGTSGNSGNVTVLAGGAISTGGIMAANNGSGNGGTVLLQSSSSSIHSSWISTNTSGSQGGAIILDAGTSVTISGYTAFYASLLSGASTGTGGSISINAGTSINISQQTETQQGSGTGGAATMITGGTITLGNWVKTGNSDDYNGNAGAITLVAGGNITATDIVANTRYANGGSVIIISTGGNVSVGTINTSAVGNAGSVAVVAAGTISISGITTNSTESQAGDIWLSSSATSGTVITAGTIDASAKGTAGSVYLLGNESTPSFSYTISNSQTNAATFYQYGSTGTNTVGTIGSSNVLPGLQTGLSGAATTITLASSDTRLIVPIVTSGAMNVSGVITSAAEPVVLVTGDSTTGIVLSGNIGSSTTNTGNVLLAAVGSAGINLGVNTVVYSNSNITIATATSSVTASSGELLSTGSSSTLTLLSGTGSFGNDTTSLSTNAPNLIANTIGNVYVNDTSAVTVTGASAAAVFSISAPAITIQAPVNATNIVSLTSTPTVSGTDIAIDASIFALGQTVNLTIADGSVNYAAINETGSGAITANTLNVNMLEVDGATASLTGNNAVGTLNVLGDNAGKFITLDNGTTSLTIGTLTASGYTGLQGLTVTSAGDINTTANYTNSANQSDGSSNYLSLTSSGTIDISNAFTFGAISLSGTTVTVSGALTSNATTNGSINIVSTQTGVGTGIAINSPVYALNSSVALSASEGINISAAVTAGPNSMLFVTSPTVSVNLVTAEGGGVQILTTNLTDSGTITATSSTWNCCIGGLGNVLIQGLDNSGSYPLNITLTGTIGGGNTTDVNFNPGQYIGSGTATYGTGGYGQTGTTYLTGYGFGPVTINTSSSTSGNISSNNAIYINNANGSNPNPYTIGMWVNNISSPSGVISVGGNTSIVTASGDLTIGYIVGNGSSNSVSITANGGSISLPDATWASINVADTLSITASGNIQLTTNAAQTITATNGIIVQAGGDYSTVSGSSLSTTNAPVSITAGGDITSGSTISSGSLTMDGNAVALNGNVTATGTVNIISTETTPSAGNNILIYNGGINAPGETVTLTVNGTNISGWIINEGTPTYPTGYINAGTLNITSNSTSSGQVIVGLYTPSGPSNDVGALNVTAAAGPVVNVQINNGSNPIALGSFTNVNNLVIDTAGAITNTTTESLTGFVTLIGTSIDISNSLSVGGLLSLLAGTNGPVSNTASISGDGVTITGTTITVGGVLTSTNTVNITSTLGAPTYSTYGPGNVIAINAPISAGGQIVNLTTNSADTSGGTASINESGTGAITAGTLNVTFNSAYGAAANLLGTNAVSILTGNGGNSNSNIYLNDGTTALTLGSLTFFRSIDVSASGEINTEASTSLFSYNPVNLTLVSSGAINLANTLITNTCCGPDGFSNVTLNGNTVVVGANLVSGNATISGPVTITALESTGSYITISPNVSLVTSPTSTLTMSSPVVNVDTGATAQGGGVAIFTTTLNDSGSIIASGSPVCCIGGLSNVLIQGLPVNALKDSPLTINLTGSISGYDVNLNPGTYVGSNGTGGAGQTGTTYDSIYGFGPVTINGNGTTTGSITTANALYINNDNTPDYTNSNTYPITMYLGSYTSNDTSGIITAGGTQNIVVGSGNVDLGYLLSTGSSNSVNITALNGSIILTPQSWAGINVAGTLSLTASSNVQLNTVSNIPAQLLEAAQGINISAGNTFTLDAVSGTSMSTVNNNISITAAALSINGSMNAGSAMVSLIPNGNQPATVGGNITSGFDVSQSALGNITASTLVIGSSTDTGNMVTGGNINVSGTGAGAYNLVFNIGGNFNNNTGTITLGNQTLSVSGGTVSISNAISSSNSSSTAISLTGTGTAAGNGIAINAAISIPGTITLTTNQTGDGSSYVITESTTGKITAGDLALQFNGNGTSTAYLLNGNTYNAGTNSAVGTGTLVNAVQQLSATSPSGINNIYLQDGSTNISLGQFNNTNNLVILTTGSITFGPSFGGTFLGSLALTGSSFDLSNNLTVDGNLDLTAITTTGITVGTNVAVTANSIIFDLSKGGTYSDNGTLTSTGPSGTFGPGGITVEDAGQLMISGTATYNPGVGNALNFESTGAGGSILLVNGMNYTINNGSGIFILTPNLLGAASGTATMTSVSSTPFYLSTGSSDGTFEIGVSSNHGSTAIDLNGTQVNINNPGYVPSPGNVQIGNGVTLSSDNGIIATVGTASNNSFSNSGTVSGNWVEVDASNITNTGTITATGSSPANVIGDYSGNIVFQSNDSHDAYDLNIALGSSSQLNAVDINLNPYNFGNVSVNNAHELNGIINASNAVYIDNANGINSNTSTISIYIGNLSGEDNILSMGGNTTIESKSGTLNLYLVSANNGDTLTLSAQNIQQINGANSGPDAAGTYILTATAGSIGTSNNPLLIAPNNTTGSALLAANAPQGNVYIESTNSNSINLGQFSLFSSLGNSAGNVYLVTSPGALTVSNTVSAGSVNLSGSQLTFNAPVTVTNTIDLTASSAGMSQGVFGALTAPGGLTVNLPNGGTAALNGASFGNNAASLIGTGSGSIILNNGNNGIELLTFGGSAQNVTVTTGGNITTGTTATNVDALTLTGNSVILSEAITAASNVEITSTDPPGGLGIGINAALNAGTNSVSLIVDGHDESGSNYVINEGASGSITAGTLNLTFNNARDTSTANLVGTNTVSLLNAQGNSHATNDVTLNNGTTNLALGSFSNIYNLDVTKAGNITTDVSFNNSVFGTISLTGTKVLLTESFTSNGAVNLTSTQTGAGTGINIGATINAPGQVVTLTADGTDMSVHHGSTDYVINETGSGTITAKTLTVNFGTDSGTTTVNLANSNAVGTLNAQGAIGAPTALNNVTLNDGSTALTIGYLININNLDITSSGGLTFSTSFAVSGNADFTTGGSVTINPPATLTANTLTFDLLNGGTFTNNGNLVATSMSGGDTIVIDPPVAIILAGTGSFAPGSGTLEFAATGSITLASSLDYHVTNGAGVLLAAPLLLGSGSPTIQVTLPTTQFTLAPYNSNTLEIGVTSGISTTINLTGSQVNLVPQGFFAQTLQIDNGVTLSATGDVNITANTINVGGTGSGASATIITTGNINVDPILSNVTFGLSAGGPSSGTLNLNGASNNISSLFGNINVDSNTTLSSINGITISVEPANFFGATYELNNNGTISGNWVQINAGNIVDNGTITATGSNPFIGNSVIGDYSGNVVIQSNGAGNALNITLGVNGSISGANVNLNPTGFGSVTVNSLGTLNGTINASNAVYVDNANVPNTNTASVQIYVNSISHNILAVGGNITIYANTGNLRAYLIESNGADKQVVLEALNGSINVGIGGSIGIYTTGDANQAVVLVANAATDTITVGAGSEVSSNEANGSSFPTIQTISNSFVNNGTVSGNWVEITAANITNNGTITATGSNPFTGNSVIGDYSGNVVIQSNAADYSLNVTLGSASSINAVDLNLNPYNFGSINVNNALELNGTIHASNAIYLDNANASNSNSSTISFYVGDLSDHENFVSVGGNTVIETADGNMNIWMVHANGTGTVTLIDNNGNINAGVAGYTTPGVTTVNGTINITASGDFTVEAGSTVTTGSNNAITVTASDIYLLNSGGFTNGSLNAGTGTITLLPYGNTENVIVGASEADRVPGDFNVTSQVLSNITTGTLVVGRLTDTGNFKVLGPVNVSGTGAGAYNLTFYTGGNYANNSSITLGTKDLTVDALGTVATGKNTSTSGNIDITAGGALTVSGRIKLDSGTLNLTGSTIAVDDKIKSKGLANLISTSTSRGTGISIAAHITVTGSGSSLNLVADGHNNGSNYVINEVSGGQVRATNLVITLNDSHSGQTSTADLNVSGGVNYVSNLSGFGGSGGVHDITLNDEASKLTIGTLSNINNLSVLDSPVYLGNTTIIGSTTIYNDGPIYINGLVTFTGGQNLDIISGGNIIAKSSTAEITTSSGNLLMIAGETMSGGVGGTTSATGGNINLSKSTEAYVINTSGLFGGGSVTLTALTNGTKGGIVNLGSNSINSSGELGSGGNISISASGSITTGNLIANGGTFFNGGSGGNITLTSTNGTISTGNIEAEGGNGAYFFIAFNGGAGGNVSLTALSSGATITAGSINVSGGNGADTLFGTGGNGGTGGTITLLTNAAGTTDSLTANGGTGGNSVLGTGGNGGAGGDITLTLSGTGAPIYSGPIPPANYIGLPGDVSFNLGSGNPPIIVYGDVTATGGNGGKGDTPALGGTGGNGGNIWFSAGSISLTGGFSVLPGSGGDPPSNGNITLIANSYPVFSSLNGVPDYFPTFVTTNGGTITIIVPGAGPFPIPTPIPTGLNLNQLLAYLDALSALLSRAQLTEDIGTRVATDYDLWLLPQYWPKTEPLQGEVEKLANNINGTLFAGMEFNRNELNLLASGGVQFGPGSNKDLFELLRGNVFLMPKHDIRVKTREGIAYIPKGAIAWIMETGADSAIYDCHDNIRTGRIKVEVNGKKLTLAPGTQVLLTKDPSSDFASLNPGYAIGYRNVVSTDVGNGVKVYVCSFSLPHIMSNIPVIHDLLKSEKPECIKVANALIKNAVILNDLTGPAGYQTNMFIASKQAPAPSTEPGVEPGTQRIQPNEQLVQPTPAPGPQATRPASPQAALPVPGPQAAAIPNHPL